MRRTILVPVLLAIVVSCGGGPAEPMDRATFEDVMVALRQAGTEADSAAFPERRRQILESAGVTDSLLFRFVRFHSTDADYMFEVWTSIDERVNGAPESAESDTVKVR